MDMLPVYLKEIACNCAQKKSAVTFDLKCTCGNETFVIVRGKTNASKQNEEKWDKYWKKFRFLPIFSFCSETERKSGKQYIYGSTFLGIRVGKFYLESSDFIQDVCIIKALCSNCSKEFVLFDNRKNGYDALASIFDAQETGVKGIRFADESLLMFRNANQGKDCSIKIFIQNNLTQEDFRETFGANASEECYSNAFTRIKVISVHEGKAKTILDMETS